MKTSLGRMPGLLLMGWMIFTAVSTETSSAAETERDGTARAAPDFGLSRLSWCGRAKWSAPGRELPIWMNPDRWSSTPVAGMPNPNAPPPDAGAPWGRPPIEIDPSIPPLEGCPARYRVAVRKARQTACPDPGRVGGAGWTIRSLFHDGPGEAALPPALRPFCLYVYEGADASVLPALDALLRGDSRLERVDPGCAALSPAALTPAAPPSNPPSAAAESWHRLEQHFLERAGQLDGPRRATSTTGASPVRLTFLDTQPSGDLNHPGNSPHGYSLARMARRLLCDGPECPVRLGTELALPIVKYLPDHPDDPRFDFERGGHFGMIYQLAQAVWREIEADSEGAPRVLNLSVAWIGERFGGLEPRVEEMPAPVQALYRVLEVASCRGALVVAASGNRAGGPDLEIGPLLPGGWERRQAPGRRACRGLLGADVDQRRRFVREPLVHAAGGVRSNDQPIATARPASEPTLVAHADHAVVEADGGQPTAILTGTSVGAMVVSSTAAAVWSLRPELSRAQLMELIERSGEPLGRAAAFQRRGERRPSEVRRIGLCGAVATACADRPEACPGDLASIPCEPPTAPLPRLSDVPWDCRVADLPARGLAVDAATISKTYAEASFCTTGELRFDPSKGPPERPCPSRQHWGITARPYTGPQPDSDPCPSCSVRPPPPSSYATGGETSAEEYQMQIDIDPAWDGGELSDAMLEIGGVGFALGLGGLAPGDCALVRGLDPRLVEPEDGPSPPIVLRFRSPWGSVSVPVFLGR